MAPLLYLWCLLALQLHASHCSFESLRRRRTAEEKEEETKDEGESKEEIIHVDTQKTSTPSKAPTHYVSFPGMLAKTLADLLKHKATPAEHMDFTDHLRELHKFTPGETMVIGCVGDSLTEGALSDKRVSSYPQLMQEKMKNPPYKVFNFGKGGVTAQQGVGTPPAAYTDTQKYKDSMSAHLDVVVLQLGTNDARKIYWNEDRFRADYIDLIERYQSLSSHPIVFVSTPPPVYCTTTCWFDIQPNIVNEVLSRLVPEIAHYTGAYLIDNFAVFGGIKFSNPASFYEPGHVKMADWSHQNRPPYDGIHLNSEGNNRLADSVSWRIMDCLQKANKTYNMYLHHVVTRDVLKIEALLNVTRSKRKKIDHEDVYKKLTNLTSLIDAGSTQTMMSPSSLGKDFIRPVIACVGDSLTEGMGSSDDYLLSYPAILQRHPGFHHFQVLNLGVASTRITKEKPDEHPIYWSLKQYELAMNSHPHIVVLQFGSNDVIEEIWDEKEFIAAYTTMIKRFQALPSRPTVYVAIPPPYYLPGKEEGLKKAINTVLPRVIRGIVKDIEGVHLIDNFAALGGKELSRPHAFTSDHLHPNDLGYFAIAHSVASVISEHELFAPITHKPPSAMRKPKESTDQATDKTPDARDNVKMETATGGKSLTPPAVASNKTIAEAKYAKEVSSALVKAAAVAATNDKQKETKPSPKGTTATTTTKDVPKEATKETPKDAGKKR